MYILVSKFSGREPDQELIDEKLCSADYKKQEYLRECFVIQEVPDDE